MPGLQQKSGQFMQMIVIAVSDYLSMEPKSDFLCGSLQGAQRSAATCPGIFFARDLPHSLAPTIVSIICFSPCPRLSKALSSDIGRTIDKKVVIAR